jgi:hypothetical protein
MPAPAGAWSTGTGSSHRRVIIAGGPALPGKSTRLHGAHFGEREGLYMKTGIWPDDVSMLQMSDWLAGLGDDGRAGPPDDGHGEPASDRGRLPQAPAAAAPGRRTASTVTRAHAEARALAEAIARAQARARALARAPTEAIAPAEARTRALARARAQASARAQALARAEARDRAHTVARAHAQLTGRAVIGDQLRLPITWCEMGSCICWHADPAALGEADIRARAIGAGWRVDAFGRLACPRCQQSDPGFRAARPVTLRDRYAVITKAAPVAAVPGGRHHRGA